MYEPVKWFSDVEKISETEYNLIFTAEIEPHWHVYSQEAVGDEGPIPTEFTFNDQEGNFELLGKTLEPDVEARLEPKKPWPLVLSSRGAFNQLVSGVTAGSKGKTSRSSSDRS